MCIGVPMRVVEANGLAAVVERRGERQRVSLALVGPLEVGVAVLVHLGSAVRVLDDAEVGLIESALDGLDAALNGQNVDGYFADLVGREPQLPEHLRPKEKT